MCAGRRGWRAARSAPAPHRAWKKLRPPGIPSRARRTRRRLPARARSPRDRDLPRAATESRPSPGALPRTLILHSAERARRPGPATPSAHRTPGSQTRSARPLRSRFARPSPTAGARSSLRRWHSEWSTPPEDVPARRGGPAPRQTEPGTECEPGVVTPRSLPGTSKVRGLLHFDSVLLNYSTNGSGTPELLLRRNRENRI